MVSTALFLSIFFVQFIQLLAFYNNVRVVVQRLSPVSANPLFFGGKRLPVKDSDKPKEVIVPDDDSEELDDINQLVRIHDEERLQKVIARAGLASRREAEKMVRDIYSIMIYSALLSIKITTRLTILRFYSVSAMDVLI